MASSIFAYPTDVYFNPLLDHMDINLAFYVDASKAIITNNFDLCYNFGSSFGLEQPIWRPGSTDYASFAIFHDAGITYYNSGGNLYEKFEGPSLYEPNNGNTVLQYGEKVAISPDGTRVFIAAPDSAQEELNPKTDISFVPYAGYIDYFKRDDNNNFVKYGKGTGYDNNFHNRFGSSLEFNHDASVFLMGGGNKKRHIWIYKNFSWIDTIHLDSFKSPSWSNYNSIMNTNLQTKLDHDGLRLFVSDMYDGSDGVVYFFRRSSIDESFNLLDKIDFSLNNASSGDRFGIDYKRVDNSFNVFAFATPEYNTVIDGVTNFTNRGKVTILTQYDGAEPHTTYTIFPDTQNDLYFGRTLCFNKDASRLAVGLPDFGQGYVAIYDVSGSRSKSLDINTLIGVNDGSLYGPRSEWVHNKDLVGENPGDGFGYSLALNDDGNTLVVGAPFCTNAGSNAGSVYIYKYDGVDWLLYGKKISVSGVNNKFGSSLAMAGNTVVIGAIDTDGNGFAKIIEIEEIGFQDPYMIRYYPPNNENNRNTKLNTQVISYCVSDGTNTDLSGAITIHIGQTGFTHKNHDLGMYFKRTSPSDLSTNYFGINGNDLGVDLLSASPSGVESVFTTVSGGSIYTLDQLLDANIRVPIQENMETTARDYFFTGGYNRIWKNDSGTDEDYMTCVFSYIYDNTENIDFINIYIERVDDVVELHVNGTYYGLVVLNSYLFENIPLKQGKNVFEIVVVEWEGAQYVSLEATYNNKILFHTNLNNNEWLVVRASKSYFTNPLPHFAIDVPLYRGLSTYFSAAVTSSYSNVFLTGVSTLEEGDNLTEIQGNGALLRNDYIYGDTTSTLKIPDSDWPGVEYTFFHVTKYNGDDKNRIWSTTTDIGDTASGFWGSYMATGVHGVDFMNTDDLLDYPTRPYHYFDDDDPNFGFNHLVSVNNENERWVITTEQPGRFRFNFLDNDYKTRLQSEFIKVLDKKPSTMDGYSINIAVLNEESDWACKMFYVYNRLLTTKEIEFVENFIWNNFISGRYNGRHHLREVIPYNYDPTLGVPVKDMISHYYAKSYDNANNKWYNRSHTPYTRDVSLNIRDISGTDISGVHYAVEDISNNHGTLVAADYLYGDVDSFVTIPLGANLSNVIADYTLFHITRYNGAPQGRLWQGTHPTNWWSGHHGNRSGTVYHENSVVFQGDIPVINGKQHWILSVDQRTKYRYSFLDFTDNISRKLYHTDGSGYGTHNPSHISINNGMFSAGTNNPLVPKTDKDGNTVLDGNGNIVYVPTWGVESATWASMNFILYDRLLSPKEIAQVETHLWHQYFVGNDYDGTYGLPVLGNIIGYYQPSLYGGLVWTDSSSKGNHIHEFTGDIYIANNSGKNGSLANEPYIYGNINATLTLGTDIWPSSEYTFIHIARYNGVEKGRIWTGNTHPIDESSNWLSGFHGGGQGVAYQGNANHALDEDGKSTPVMSGVEKWTLIVDQPRKIRTNYFDSNNIWKIDQKMIASHLPINYQTSIAINLGYASTPGNPSTETSDWALMTTLIYDRVLSSTEILQVEHHLWEKYMGGPSFDPTMGIPVKTNLTNFYHPYYFVNNVWADHSNSNNHISETDISGNIQIGSSSGYGTLKTNSYIYGDVSSSLIIRPSVWPQNNNFTFFHITKYNGENKGRIWSSIGNSPNYFSGFHRNGGVGSSHQHGGLSNSTTPISVSNDRWIISTDQFHKYRRTYLTSDNKKRIMDQFTSDYTDSTYNLSQIGINTYLKYSDWACMAVIIYDRVLDEKEIIQVENHLWEQYIGGSSSDNKVESYYHNFNLDSQYANGKKVILKSENEIAGGAIFKNGYYPLYTSLKYSNSVSKRKGSHKHVIDGVTYYMPNLPLGVDTFHPPPYLSLNGYYPLYTSMSDSNYMSNGNGSHTHIINGVTYYMPNLTMGVDIFHPPITLDLVVYISPQSQLTNNGTNYTNWVTNYASGSSVSNIRISNISDPLNYRKLSDDITHSIYDNFNTDISFTDGVFNLLSKNVMYFINNEYDFTNGFTIAFRILEDFYHWERVLQITKNVADEDLNGLVTQIPNAIDLTWDNSYRGRQPYFPDSISNSVDASGHYVFTVSSLECVFYYNGTENKKITTSDSNFNGSGFLSSISSTGEYKYFRIGAYNGTPYNDYVCSEFRIYNKVLSSEDVQTLYNNLPVLDPV